MNVVRIKVSSPLGTLVQGVQLKAGRFRYRGFPNISETLEVDDLSPLEGALRGIQEELGISLEASRLTPVGFQQETKRSSTTGDVKSYAFWDFALTLTLWEALAVPLVISEGDATTFCFWR